jgi:hypothetical protein
MDGEIEVIDEKIEVKVTCKENLAAAFSYPSDSYISIKRTLAFIAIYATSRAVFNPGNPKIGPNSPVQKDPVLINGADSLYPETDI